MFLTGFEKWRSALFAGGRFVALADLGQGVMEQALVEAAAYVLHLGRRSILGPPQLSSG